MFVSVGLMKRASNVNEDYPFTATIPAGTKCTGIVVGQNNVRLVKIVNPSGAGPSVVSLQTNRLQVKQLPLPLPPRQSVPSSVLSSVRKRVAIYVLQGAFKSHGMTW
jgi:hypothetical protein